MQKKHMTITVGHCYLPHMATHMGKVMVRDMRLATPPTLLPKRPMAQILPQQQPTTMTAPVPTLTTAQAITKSVPAGYHSFYITL